MGSRGPPVGEPTPESRYALLRYSYYAVCGCASMRFFFSLHVGSITILDCACSQSLHRYEIAVIRKSTPTRPVNDK